MIDHRIGLQGVKTEMSCSHLLLKGDNLGYLKNSPMQKSSLVDWIGEKETFCQPIRLDKMFALTLFKLKQQSK